MNAIEFVKKFGLDLAKRDVAAWQSGFIKREDFLENYGFDILDSLKQIVDAFELVDQWGGLEDAKLYDLSHCKSKPDSIGYKLMKAINLVEQCNA